MTGRLVVELVRDARFTQLDAPEQALAFYLAAKHADGAAVCWTSVGKLAAGLGIDRRTVQRRLRKLCATGIVEIVEWERPNGSQSSNVYRFDLDLPEHHSAEWLEGIDLGDWDDVGEPEPLGADIEDDPF